MLRYPGERLQSYLGLELAVVCARADLSGESTTATSPGLNALAGLKGFITPNLALFGEVKYAYAHLNFCGGFKGMGAAAAVEGNLGMFSLVGGLAFHFPRAV